MGMARTSARAPHFERWLSDAAILEATPRLWKLAAFFGITSSYEPPPQIRESAASGRDLVQVDYGAMLAYSPCSTNERGEVQACEHLGQCQQRKCCQAFHQFTTFRTTPSESASYLQADRTPCRERYSRLFGGE